MNYNRILDIRHYLIQHLVPLINKDYVLLDVPNHRNIGDNLIWEGELLFLNNYVNYLKRYSANVVNVDFSYIKDNVILFHGGGNFGDLYPECQELRVDIARKFVNNRIIILPQTVFYRDNSKLIQDCEVFNAHPDITICLRDKKSYDILSGYISIDKLLLLPDMAFFVDVRSNNNFGGKILLMQRTDQESLDISFVMNNIYKENINSILDVKDWPTFSNNKYINIVMSRFIIYKNIISRKLQYIPYLSKIVDSDYGLNSRFNREKYVRTGIEFLDQYEEVYTTRLHGLILALLLNKKVTIVDNNYGKCRSFYETWLTDFDNIRII